MGNWPFSLLLGSFIAQGNRTVSVSKAKNPHCSPSQVRLQSKEGTLNCSTFSGPWSKVKGISLQAGWPPHSGLSWSESCRCPSASRWLNYCTTVSARKLHGTIYIKPSPGETFPVPYLDSSVPYLATSTIAFEGGKEETETFS